MVSVSLQTVGVEDLRSALRRAGDRWPEVARKIAEDDTELGRHEAEHEVRAENLIATGSLLGSFKSEVKTQGESADARVFGTVLTNLVQGAVQNAGREAGTWSGRDLMRWIVLKIGDFSGLLTKRGKARKSRKAQVGGAAQAEIDARRISYVIAKSIREKGEKARPFMDRAAAAMQRGLAGITERALDWFQREAGF